MKVSELIEKLMEYPLDMEVKVVGYGWDSWEEPDLDTEYLPGSIVIDCDPMTPARKLKPGNWIVCPHTGLPEKVLFSRSGTPGRRFVRTMGHDHNMASDQVVDVLNPNVVDLLKTQITPKGTQ